MISLILPAAQLALRKVESCGRTVSDKAQY